MVVMEERPLLISVPVMSTSAYCNANIAQFCSDESPKLQEACLFCCIVAMEQRSKPARNRIYLCVQGRETEYQVGEKLVTCIYLEGLSPLKSVKAESKSSRLKELPHGL